MAQTRPAFMDSVWWDELNFKLKKGAPKEIIAAYRAWYDADTPKPPELPPLPPRKR